MQTPCQKYWPELLKMIQEGTLTPYKVCHSCMYQHASIAECDGCHCSMLRPALNYKGS